MSSDSSSSVPAPPSPLMATTDLQSQDLPMRDDLDLQTLQATTGVLPQASNDLPNTIQIMMPGNSDDTGTGARPPVEEAVLQIISPIPDETIEISDAPKPTETEVLQTHKKLIQQDTIDLVDTIQTIFEEDSTVRENGVLLLDAPFLIPAAGDITLPPPNYHFEATSQRVMTPAKLLGQGLVVIKHEQAKLTVEKPKFAPFKELTPEEMEAVFRNQIEEHTNQSSRHPYFNIDISDYKVRPKGSFELTCGSPMDKLSYIAGVNTPYGYYSRNISHFGAHVEDWHCASYNILFAGATKLWIAVKPSSQELFESKIRELFPEAGKCVQFMRHLALNLAPSALRKWGVEHFFVPQRPGQIVAVSGYTYHWGINTGHNYAEAINFCMEKDWKASENFKNCYPGCGINEDTSMPLPMPVKEEGTMEEKKARAIARDEAFLETWQKQCHGRHVELGLYEEPVKKSGTKKSRASTMRLQSEAADSQRRPAHISMPSRGHYTPATSSRKGVSNELLDRIEVSRAAQQLNGRANRRQMTSQRTAYAAVDSSPSEAGSTDDDEAPVQRMKHMKPSHSRNNSGHHLQREQPDVGAILTEMRTIKGYFMEQKKAAAKTEEMLLKQLHYQKRQSDDIREQLTATQTMLQVMLGMDHRMMLTSQRAETRNLLMASHQSSNAPSEVYAPSAASASAGHHSFGQQPNRHAAPMLDHASHSVPDSSRSQADVQSHFRGRQVPQVGPQTHQRQQSAQEHSMRTTLHALERPIVPHSASNQTSRRPSAIDLSEHSSENGTHLSSAFSPVTPHVESMHSTPQVEMETASSAPSSLSEQCSDESTILVKSKPIKVAARRVTTKVTGQEEDEEEMQSPSAPSSGSEYTERPQKKKTPRRSTSSAARSASTSPSSSLNIPERAVVLKVAQGKRTADEVEDTNAGDMKRAKMSPPATTGSIQQQAVNSKSAAAGARRQCVPGSGGVRELLSLGATSEWAGSKLPEPGSRRARSKPLGL